MQQITTTNRCTSLIWVDSTIDQALNFKHRSTQLPGPLEKYDNGLDYPQNTKKDAISKIRLKLESLQLIRETERKMHPIPAVHRLKVVFIVLGIKEKKNSKSEKEKSRRPLQTRCLFDP